MRRFDVYENPSPRMRDIAPYVVVLQSHYLEGMPSVVVAPLLRAENAEVIKHLSVPASIGPERLFISLHELAAIDTKSLRRRSGNVVSLQDEIDRGLQRLFTGF